MQSGARLAGSFTAVNYLIESITIAASLLIFMVDLECILEAFEFMAATLPFSSDSSSDDVKSVTQTNTSCTSA